MMALVTAGACQEPRSCSCHYRENRRIAPAFGGALKLVPGSLEPQPVTGARSHGVATISGNLLSGGPAGKRPR
jgi:hypothetical protein